MSQNYSSDNDLASHLLNQCYVDPVQSRSYASPGLVDPIIDIAYARFFLDSPLQKDNH